MNSVEEFGKTVEEATAKALQALGIGEADAEIVVVDPAARAAG